MLGFDALGRLSIGQLPTAAGPTTFNQAVNVASAASASLARATAKAINAGCASAILLARLCGKHLGITGISASAISRSAGKLLAVSSLSVTTITKFRTVVQIIAAGCSAVTSIVRGVSKHVFPVSSGVISLQKLVLKYVAVSGATDTVALPFKIIIKIITAGCASATDLAKLVSKNVYGACAGLVAFILNFWRTEPKSNEAWSMQSQSNEAWTERQKSTEPWAETSAPSSSWTQARQDNEGWS